MIRKNLVLAISIAFGIVLMNTVSMGNIYALKDKDFRYGIVTIDNVKAKSFEVTAYIYDEKKEKKNQRQS